jgi:hypothetical protein
MQYLLMCRFDETRWVQLPDAQKGQIMQEYRAFIQDLVTSGHVRAGAKLQPSSMATTVRQQHGKLLTTDGPFAETKEQLGGHHLVEVRPVVPASER